MSTTPSLKERACKSQVDQTTNRRIKLFVDDKTEIGTLECRLSSNHYGYTLNRTKVLSPVRITPNLSLSGREEVGLTGLLQTQLTRITPFTGGFNECSFM
jgi:hypothetical protein